MFPLNKCINQTSLIPWNVEKTTTAYHDLHTSFSKQYLQTFNVKHTHTQDYTEHQ